MKIRALKAFTIRDSETGELASIAHGGIAEVSDTLGSSLISDGLAEAYTLISPTGSINISTNGTVDVTEYASAVINVPDFKNLVERTITSVTADMLAGFTKIGSHAFFSCPLTSVTIPNNVTIIEEAAFAECRNLESIEIPNSVTSIGALAFENCQSLTSIEIPATVTEIGNSAFYYCTDLESVTVLATTPPTLEYATFDETSPDLVIYVPAESVDAYKTSTYEWVDYADKIQAIQE